MVNDHFLGGDREWTKANGKLLQSLLYIGRKMNEVYLYTQRFLTSVPVVKPYYNNKTFYNPTPELIYLPSTTQSVIANRNGTM